MIAGQLSMTAVVLVLGAHMPTVIHGVAMGQALHGVAAMAEGHHGGRRDKAKCGEGGKQNRHTKEKPAAEHLQHGASLVPPIAGRKRKP
jgi:hypothetical protein